MSNLKWFDTPEFRNVCMANKLEAAINGDGNLVLICPKYPGKAIEEKLAGMIPKEQPWQIVEGASMGLLASLKVMLMMFGARNVLFTHHLDHRLILDIHNPPKSTALQPGSPLWDQIAGAMKSDEFVQTYQIRVDGEVYRDSDGYTKADDLPATPEEMEDDGDHRPLSEQAKESTQEFQRAQREPPKPVVKAKVEDNRFDYDREFLPKDVGTDVKILLESCNSVEEFLKNI